MSFHRIANTLLKKDQLYPKPVILTKVFCNCATSASCFQESFFFFLHHVSYTNYLPINHTLTKVRREKQRIGT